MKIVQTPPRFYPCVGGVENYVYYLSGELVKLGNDITVICANEPKNKKKEIINGIKIKRLPYIGKIANTNITPQLPITLASEEFDIIHTHLPTPWSADWSAITSKLNKKPLVVSYYNDIVGNGIFNYISKIYNLTSLKFLLNQADKIIIIQEDYIRFSPYLEKYKDKIEVIPVGVDIDKFKPSKVNNNKNSIFFLSILDEYHRYKGLDYLLNALKIVKREIPDVKLIVGGKGKLVKFYQEMAISLDLKENIEFHGFIPDEKIVEYYNNSNAFILPSISSSQEGFGIVALEALACKKPVIITEIVGITKDLKKHEAGIVVPAKDPIALAQAITTILSDVESSRKMGKRGRSLVEEKYTWKKIAKMTEKIYEALL